MKPISPCFTGVLEQNKRMANETDMINLLKKEYDTVSPLADNFAGELDRQLTKLLLENKIALGFPIQARIKTWDSLREKIDRRSLTLKSVTELHDLIGFRIIVLFRRSLEQTTALLDKHFKVISKEDTAARLTENEFGYQSIHYVIELPDEWFALPTLKGMKGLKVEVQIRTVAQHIWAASSHVLQYKHESSVPSTLRRTIHRVSALLETVDLEFERVLAENEKYAAEVVLDEPDQELNVVTLEKVLAESLPARNLNETENQEGYADLLEELIQNKISTVKSLRQAFDKWLPQALTKDKKIADAIAADKSNHASVFFLGQNFNAKPGSRLRAEKGCFYSYKGLVRQVLEDMAAKKI
jgi:putative GTP pyrophosphokinase